MHNLDKRVIGNIMERLRNYSNINFIVVADHGMSDMTDNRTDLLYMNDYLDKDSFLLKGSQYVKPTKNYTIDDLWRNLTKLNDTGAVEIYR